MCFDHDSRPPIAPIPGGSLDARAVHRFVDRKAEDLAAQSSDARGGALCFIRTGTED